VAVSCELVSPRADEPLSYDATDLSPHGMWIQTADPVRAGETVVVCFEPVQRWSGGQLMVFAEVARVSTSRRCESQPGVGMGLEFLDLTPREERLITNWLRDKRSPVPRRRRPVPASHPAATASTPLRWR